MATSHASNAVPVAAQVAAGGPPVGPDDATLVALARARPDFAWAEGRDIAEAHNAHATNTRAELASALADSYDWCEGDVGMQGRTPVMRHLAKDAVDLDLATWVKVVAESGRGAKFDLKDIAALPAVLDLAARAGIPQHRLIINIADFSPDVLRSIRTAFPEAIVNLSPISDADLTAMDLAELQVAARMVGGRVMFPIRLDLLTETVLRQLRPFGKVAIWNQPQLSNPRRDEHARLRSRGVGGMIDLREPQGIRELVYSTVIGGAAKVFGWGPVHKALDAVGLL